MDHVMRMITLLLLVTMVTAAPYGEKERSHAKSGKSSAGKPTSFED